MAKRNLEWNENKLNRFIKEGRGQGEGKEYKPWLTIQDFPSLGRVTRVYSDKTQRVHHFFSDNETRMFYLLNWEDTVIDIREHFPIIDMEQVITDKKGLELGKFADKKNGTPYVFTTTFLVTIIDKNGKKRYIARSVKSANELEHKHTIERFEIERRYWESKGIDWGIITQKDIPLIKAKNIEWVYSTLEDSDERGLDDNSKVSLSQVLLSKLEVNSVALRKITTELDDDYNLDAGTGLYLFKYLIATKTITVDMNSKIDINAPAQKVIKTIQIIGGSSCVRDNIG